MPKRDTPVEVYQGDTFHHLVTVTGVDLTGVEVVAQLRASSGAVSALAEMRCVVPSGSTFPLTLAPSATAELPTGPAVMDVEGRWGADVVRTFFWTDVDVIADVTR